MDYKGLKCPICGKPFSEGDDIVVCPQCGAPYHRECYEREGKCIYADRHGTPDAWKRPEPESGADKAGTKRCPQCGTPNDEGAAFCAHCGQPFSSGNEPVEGNPFPYQNQSPNGGPNSNAPGSRQQNGFPPQGGNVPPNFGSQGQPFPFSMDPLGGVNPSEPVGGVPAGDLAKYIQGNTQYYLPVFAGMTHFGKNRFNFSAFFFQGVWMLYRKMYKIGTVIAAIQGTLLFSYFFALRYFILPFYEKLYSLAGITRGTYGYTITAEQQMRLAQVVYALPAQQKFLAISPLLFFILFFAIMLICGFNGNRTYFRHCVTQVSRIRRETSAPTDFAVRLQQEGGMNTVLGASLGLCLLLIYFFSML